MAKEKKKMGFFKKMTLLVFGLAVLVVVGGGVAAKVTGDPNC